MTHDLKPGDVVRLKSGGPPMTVNAIDDQDMAWTIWFDHGRQGSARFDQAALVLERTGGGSGEPRPASPTR
jgi:uncharacterized protein YodC (DUF2158 family)